jgi:hypothetical protein
VVQELIAECGAHERILDPFCGTATTALTAGYFGHSFATVEVNPFLVWFGRVKTGQYSTSDLDEAKSAAQAAAAGLSAEHGRVAALPPPPLHNISRWWPEDALQILCGLKAAIVGATKPDTAARSLLEVAFCRTLISLSNAAFNHQSMSFKETKQGRLPLAADWKRGFLADVNFILASAGENPSATGLVISGDSRCLDATALGRFDRVITSPPYVNRMSYIRELRPYMYWLGYLSSGREAGEMDWRAIGGTWGIATSRLGGWAPSDVSHLTPELTAIIARIATPENKNGQLLANYISKYFADIRAHLRSLKGVLNPGATVHYIVGNSAFYGVLLPAERFYAESFESLGFQDVSCKPIRKRNSKKELVEFEVRALFPG